MTNSERAEELHEDVITRWPLGEGFVTSQKTIFLFSFILFGFFFAVAGERASFMLMKGPVSRGSLRIPVGLCYGFWVIRPPTRSESVKGML